jgi:hypothetical protein
MQMKGGLLFLPVLLLVGCSPQASHGESHSDVIEKTPELVAARLAHRPTGLRPCNREQLLAYAPDREALLPRRKTGPVVSYPSGAKGADDRWGFDVALRIDESGRVVCYGSKGRFGEPIQFNAARLSALSDFRYEPFMRDGVPTSAVITEEVREQEMLGAHLLLPAASLDKVRISLERTGCFGTCPAYKVDVYGDGRVVYSGKHFVDVEGEHRYRIPVQDVAGLVESMRAKDIWSMRPSYRAMITDNPSYDLTIDVGGTVHEIHDYVGAMVGMPVAVTEFEDEVDKVARSAMWINLSLEAVNLLEAESFAFDSPAAAAILRRAMQNDRGKDNGAVLRLIELGAPWDAKVEEPGFGMRDGSLLEEALRNRRHSAVEPLIERGALGKNGGLEQSKLDAAFRAAIEGGSLDLVQKIWNAGGSPSLYFVDVADDKTNAQPVPVTLLLDPPYADKQDWQGLEIAQWLQAKGCDLKAAAVDGTTLLHIATKAGDPAFVRYLLDQGLDPSTPGEFGLPALGSADDEDVALVLLEAGTDLSKMDGGGKSFMHYAEEQHWGRVVARLRKTPH